MRDNTLIYFQTQAGLAAFTSFHSFSYLSFLPVLKCLLQPGLAPPVPPLLLLCRLALLVMLLHFIATFSTGDNTLIIVKSKLVLLPFQLFTVSLNFSLLYFLVLTMAPTTRSHSSRASLSPAALASVWRAASRAVSAAPLASIEETEGEMAPRGRASATRATIPVAISTGYGSLGRLGSRSTDLSISRRLKTADGPGYRRGPMARGAMIIDLYNLGELLEAVAHHGYVQGN